MKRLFVISAITAALTVVVIFTILYTLTIPRSTAGADGEKQLSITISEDPKTIIEFRKQVSAAAKEGANRVKFLSGEWNWYDPVYNYLPKKDKLSDVTYDNKSFSDDKLAKWITENRIERVLISLPDDLDPNLFFMVERTLRLHKVAYWFESTESEKIQPGHIGIQETN